MGASCVDQVLDLAAFLDEVLERLARLGASRGSQVLDLAALLDEVLGLCVPCPSSQNAQSAVIWRLE